MELETFRDEVRARGRECSVWIVYLADRLAELEDGRLSLLLKQAFFNRGEAYSLAERCRQQRQWQHYYVFRIAVDRTWAEGDAPGRAEYETAFGRVRELPGAELTPAQLAAAIQK
jgi:hypothetical protein